MNHNSQQPKKVNFIALQMGILLVTNILLLPQFVHAQKVDNTVSYRQMQSDKYFRINYENDYFAAGDENYTQGYSLELVAPGLSDNPVNKLLFKLKNTENLRGIAFEHVGYTPNSYEKTAIQQGDRPFAAVVMFKNFNISISKETKERLSSHLSIGVMGPTAKGQEIQTLIHSFTGCRVPDGWQNQIENHFIFNYGVDYEKEVIRIKNYFSLQANASAKVGSLFTNATVGFSSTLGLLGNTYESDFSPKKALIYAYFQPLATVVCFDGTLQGSLFQDHSIYTIPGNGINRITTQLNYGIVLQVKSMYIEYSRSNVSKEIKTLYPAGWGGIRLGLLI